MDATGLALSIALAGGLFYGARFVPNLDPFFHPQAHHVAAGSLDGTSPSGGFSHQGNTSRNAELPAAMTALPATPRHASLDATAATLSHNVATSVPDGKFGSHMHSLSYVHTPTPDGGSQNISEEFVLPLPIPVSTNTGVGVRQVQTDTSSDDAATAMERGIPSAHAAIAATVAVAPNTVLPVSPNPDGMDDSKGIPTFPLRELASLLPRPQERAASSAPSFLLSRKTAGETAGLVGVQVASTLGTPSATNTTRGTFTRATGTDLIADGGFESPSVAANSSYFVQAQTLPSGFISVNGNQGGLYKAGPIPGWLTTSYSTSLKQYVVEIWNGTFRSPSEGPGPYAGSQYAEMNSVSAGTLFQYVPNQLPGSTLYLSFAHAGRAGAEPSLMRVTLFDLGPNGTFDSFFATPSNTSAILGGDDQFLLNQMIGPAVYDPTLNPLSLNWSFYDFQLPATTPDNMLLAFQSVSDSMKGNFLDAVSLSDVNPTASSTPEPGSLAFLAFAATFGVAGLVRFPAIKQTIAR